MIKVHNINFECDRIKIPTSIDLNNWEEVVQYARAYLFHTSTLTHTIEIVETADLENTMAELITIDTESDLNLDIFDAIHEGKEAVEYHENVWFEPTYFETVYITDERLIDSACFEMDHDLSLAVFEVLQLDMFLDGSMIDEAPRYEIDPPEINVLCVALEASKKTIDSWLEEAMGAAAQEDRDLAIDVINTFIGALSNMHMLECGTIEMNMNM